jgi:hypothetical protein
MNVLPFPVEGRRKVDPVVRETQRLLRLRDARDEAAFVQLFGCFAVSIRGYLQRTGLDPTDADGVAQGGKN